MSQQPNLQPIGRTTRPHLGDPLFIQIEMRLVLTKENGNRHLVRGTSLQKFPFQMWQGSLKLYVGFVRRSGITVNQAQILGFLGVKPDANIFSITEKNN